MASATHLSRSDPASAGPGRSGADGEEPPGVITRFRRGVIAGLSIPLLGLIILAVPVMLAWVVPGSDSVSANSALRAAALALLSGLHGGVVLGGQLTTLPPLTVTVLLGWLMCGPARRLDSTSGFAGLVVGFALSCVALARWSSLGQTYAPVERSGAAGALFLLIVGGSARWSPQLWAKLAPRWRRVATAAAAVLAAYVVSGAFLVAAQLVLHHSAASAIQAKVAPGSGGLAVLLLGVGAAPNTVIAAIGYLTGFGFDVGANTSVSVRSVSRGPLPDFPVLAALPHAAGLSVTGVILLCLSAVLAGVIAVTVLGPTGRGWPGLADIASVAAVVGVGLGVLGGYARGGVGTGALRGVGVLSWQIGAGAAACVFVGSVLAAAGAWSHRVLRRTSDSRTSDSRENDSQENARRTSAGGTRDSPSLSLVSALPVEADVPSDAGVAVEADADADAEADEEGDGEADEEGDGEADGSPDAAGDPAPDAAVSEIRPTG